LRFLQGFKRKNLGFSKQFSSPGAKSTTVNTAKQRLVLFHFCKPLVADL